MKTEYAIEGGCLQRNSVEHEKYVGAYSTDSRESRERDGANLLEKVLERENLNRAYKRVKANRGAPGVDGMKVEEVLEWLKEHKGELLGRIRKGKYKPKPVRRKEIPKGDGGVRKLGIPTVIDRIIQQAIAQVLTPIYQDKRMKKEYEIKRRKPKNKNKLYFIKDENSFKNPKQIPKTVQRLGRWQNTFCA